MIRQKCNKLMYSKINKIYKTFHLNVLNKQYSTNRKVFLYNLGLIEYEEVWKLQKHLISLRCNLPLNQSKSIHDIILLLEHKDIYTIGRGGSLSNIRFNPNDPKCSYKLLKVDRGGEVTYHGPGQLVVYPILDLKYYKKDLHWYLRQIEEVVIKILLSFGLKGIRLPGLTGVWLNEKTKIAAVGTHASKWFTMHGFSLNVNTDLKPFEQIIPCGIRDRQVTSLHHHIPNITISQVQKATQKAFEDVFLMNTEDLGYVTPEKLYKIESNRNKNDVTF